MIKHLHTFSREESEKDEIDLSNLSICSTEEEDAATKPVNGRTNNNAAHAFNFDEEDVENDDPSSRYRRPQDSFGKPSAKIKNQHEIISAITSIVPPTNTHDEEIVPEALLKNQREILSAITSINDKEIVREAQLKNQRKTLSIITSSVALPTDTNNNEFVPKELDPRSPRSRVLGELCVNSPQNLNVETERDVIKAHSFSTTNKDVVIPKNLDPRSPINSPNNTVRAKIGGNVKFNTLPIDTANHARELETRSPRVLGELKINSPNNSLAKNNRSGGKVDVKQKIEDGKTSCYPAAYSRLH